MGISIYMLPSKNFFGDWQSFVIDIKQIFLRSDGRVFHELGTVYIFKIVIKLSSVRVWYFVDQSQKIRVLKYPRFCGKIRQGHRYYVYFLL